MINYVFKTYLALMQMGDQRVIVTAKSEFYKDKDLEYPRYCTQFFESLAVVYDFCMNGLELNDKLFKSAG